MGVAGRLVLSSQVTQDAAFGSDPSSPRDPLDPAVLRTVREIISRLQLRRLSFSGRVRASTGDQRVRPYRHRSDELDLDHTLEILLDGPHPSSEDLMVREPEVTRREVALVVDLSGSMRGERARMAAATVGALAAQLTADELVVIAFWSDAALLKPLGEPCLPLDLVREMLDLRASGLTNVSFALQVAGQQLSGDPARECRVILLSDCVHNAGPDPREAARALPRVDVLFDNGGESDAAMAQDLARLGRGHLREVLTPRDVAEALTALFGG